MPRRNQRAIHEPLDLTPKRYRRPQIATGPRQPVTDPSSPAARRQREAAEREKTARINRGMDWSVCLVPGCGDELASWGTLHHSIPAERDHTVALPMCHRHLAVAHQQANRDRNDELLVDASARVLERKSERTAAAREADKLARAAITRGSIYFVRLNGLVKVGWSSDVDERLRAYGPDVEVLCIYPATRDDEGHLHRQLRPVLAKGREWYEDGKVIGDFVASIVSEHGQPSWADWWTTPKKVVASKRIR